MVSYMINFALAVILALVLTPLATMVAKKWDVMDYPGERRIHTVPIPRLGGVAIYLSFWLVVLTHVTLSKMIIGLLLGSTILFIAGLVDDIRGIRPLVKLGWQLTAAIILLFYGLQVNQMTLPFIGTVDLGFFGYVFAVFWIVGIVNTVNISDGLDGLAAGICFIAALILFWAANGIEQVTASYLMLALAGVALGFLFYNYHPAKVFMGDSGSMFMGYILGAVSIWSLLKTATILSLVFPLLVLGMPLTDLVFAIIRRRWRGISITRADRGHLHHRLLDAGLSQRKAVLILYLLTSLFGIAAVLSIYQYTYLALGIVLLSLGFILRIMFSKYLRKVRDNKPYRKEKFR